MNALSIGQILFYAVFLIIVGYPLGMFMARIYMNDGVIGIRWLAFLENSFYRVIRIDSKREQDWKSYAKSVVIFSIVFSALDYAIFRLQGHLFLNPDHLPGVASHISLNTTASFVTNTNWQYYGGEYTMSYLSQMAILAVQQFVSAAVGMAVLAAVIRGLSRRSTNELGNFWRDLYRSAVYILLPLSLILAIVLISQGVPQTFSGAASATTLEGANQTIARGPVASMIAIKQLGTNGGGFYNSNSSVPFENPNGLTNFLEMLSILLIPVSQVFMFGKMILQRRQAMAIVGAMFVMFAIGIAVITPLEQQGSQVLQTSGVDLTASNDQSGGNMQDKEVRFGIANTALWASTTTNASNGSVNGGHDALTAGGGAVPIVNMFSGEVIWGGVGSGLYGMFFYVLITVFIAGLMVGRTPEYLGKKIEAKEIKLAAVGALFVPSHGPDHDGGLRRHGPWSGVDVQPRRPRLLGGAVRVHLAVEQQRQRVRGLRGHELLGFPRECRALLRTLRAAHRGAGGRRFARPEEGCAPLRRDVPHRQRDVHLPSHRA